MALKAAPYSVVDGYREVGDQTASGSSILKVDWDQLMFELDMDNGVPPFLIERANKETINDQTHKWAVDADVPDQIYVNFAAGYAADAVSIVVNDATYVPQMSVWRDIRTNENILVSQVTTGTNTLTIPASIGRGWGSTAAAINHEDTLRYVGRVSAEGSYVGTILTTTPAVYLNYTRTQRVPCGATGHSLRTVLQVGGKDYPRQWAKCMRDYKRGKALAFYWGTPVAPSTSYNQQTSGNIGGIQNSTTAKISDMGGLFYFLNTYAPTGNKCDAGGTLTMTELMDWFEQVFDRGGKTKILFHCQKIGWAMSKWMKDVAKLSMREDSKKSINLDVTRFEFSGGIAVDTVLDKMLDAPKVGTAATAGWAFLLDFTDAAAAPIYLERVATEHRTGQEGSDKYMKYQLGDGIIEELYGEFSFKLRACDRHGFMYNIAAAA